ncbi:MAG TPA: MarR family winged helix-turn-helix transcriptional regulator [Bryobacteraceae bacterium]|jgi:DNA-binding MarR family transcriptional regulator
MSTSTSLKSSGAQGRNGRRESGGKSLPLTVTRPELLNAGSDRDFRAFVHGILAFSARLEAVRAGFGGIVGLTGIQYTILISVSHLELSGEVSVSRIAEQLHVSGAFVTIECGKLLKQGLLTKRPDPRDRRRVCLGITRKGAELLERLAPIQAQVNDVLFAFLDGPQFQQFRGMVDRMTECGDQAVALLKFLAR